MNKTKLLQQVEALKASQSQYNAITCMVDIEPQLEALETMDPNLPLYGQGIVIKDNVSTKGILTTASSKILNNYVPIFDAHIVDKLKAAGAVILAKTTLDELAMGGTGLTPSQGPTHNPYDVNRIAGGSSSGSAALAGAQLVDFAIGSDTGDSVRKPAAYCGVVGVKPTYGRISRYGIIPYASSLDHVGYFSQTVKQSALLLEVLAGRDDRDLTSSFTAVDQYTDITGDLVGKKVGILKNTLVSVDPILRQRFDAFVAQVSDAGAIVTEIEMNNELLQSLFATYYIIANCEATANHANLDGLRFGVRSEQATYKETIQMSREEGFGSLVKRRFMVGSYGLEDANQEEVFRKAQKVRRLIVDDLKKAMKDVDIVLTLAAAEVAPLASEANQIKKNDTSLIADNHMVLGNFSGYPSMTIPIDFVDGLPIGINLMAHPFKEKLMFDVALGMESLAQFALKREEVVGA